MESEGAMTPSKRPKSVSGQKVVPPTKVMYYHKMFNRQPRVLKRLRKNQDQYKILLSEF